MAKTARPFARRVVNTLVNEALPLVGREWSRPSHPMVLLKQRGTIIPCNKQCPKPLTVSRPRQSIILALMTDASKSSGHLTLNLLRPLRNGGFNRKRTEWPREVPWISSPAYMVCTVVSSRASVNGRGFTDEGTKTTRGPCMRVPNQHPPL